MFGLGLSLPTLSGQGRGTPWFRSSAHLLDGVAPGFFVDMVDARHALAGIGGRPLSDLLVNANASTAGTRIDAAGQIVACAAGELRIDRTADVSELLAEGQATNHHTAANAFGPSATYGGVLAATGVVDPCGAQEVAFTETSVNNIHGVQSVNALTTTSGAVTCASVFVKPAGRFFVQITFLSASHGTGQYANFALTGAGATSAVGGSAGIAALGGGYYRIWFAATATAAAASGWQLTSATGLGDARIPATAGLAAVAFVAKAPQLEIGSAPTAYVPTAGTTVTRTADLVALTPAAASVLQGAGAAIAWRGSTVTPATGRILLGGASGAKLLGSDATTASTLVSQVHAIATSALPGSVGACVGWGASGTIGSDLGSAATTTASLTTPPSGVFVGPSGGLVAGQIIRLRQLVGWSLADRPSAAGVQAQARLAA